MRQHGSGETLLRLKHGTRVDEQGRFVWHAGHHWMPGVDVYFDDGAAEEELFGPQTGDDVLDGELELLNGKGAGVAQADERSAASYELIEPLHVVRGQLIRILGADGATTTAAGWRAGDGHARIVREKQDVDLLRERRLEVLRMDQREGESVLLQQ